VRKLPAVDTLGTRASSPRHLRRRRLVAYLHDELEGSRSRLIELTGLTHGRVSQLFDEQQPFGEQAAANLAEKLGLALHYFEHDAHGTEPAEGASGARSAWMLSELERDVLGALRALPAEQRLRIAADVVEQAEWHRYMAQAQRRASEAAVDGTATDAGPISAY
jgi:hypothetical protein